MKKWTNVRKAEVRTKRIYVRIRNNYVTSMHARL